MTAQPTPDHHTLRDLLDAYATEYLPRHAPETQRQYRSYHRRLAEELGDMPLAAVTPAFLRKWRDRLLQTYPAGTVRIYAAVFSSALTVAARDYAWMDENPMRRVLQPSMPPGRTRCLSEAERNALLMACLQSGNPHLHTIVVLALTTGGRKGELLGLRWGDVDVAQAVVRFLRTKNKRPRTVPICGQALTLLTQRGQGQRAEGWVFAREDGLRPVYIDKCWQVARRRAKIKSFKFHDLRHTAASYLAMSGASLLEISVILGHRNISTTARYTHLTTSHTAGVLQKMVGQFLDGND